MTAGGSAGRLLEVSDLTVAYRRDVVLSNVNLPPLACGQLVAVLGANGAGKSTFLKALAGQLGYRGSVRFDGIELSGQSHSERMARMSYAPQTPPQISQLLSYEYALSALRAAAPDLTAAEARDRVARSFDRLRLGPHALKPVRALSGGQRQMLGLSRIFARDTPLALLDEPTSALDMRWEIEALTAMRDRAVETDALFLLVLHDLNLALRFCDRIVMLDAGKVAAAGPVDDVLSPELLRQCFGIEARIEACSLGRPLVLGDRALPS